MCVESAECANIRLKPLLIWTSQFDGMCQSILHLKQVAHKLGYYLWSCERERAWKVITVGGLYFYWLWCCDAGLLASSRLPPIAQMLISSSRLRGVITLQVVIKVFVKIINTTRFAHWAVQLDMHEPRVQALKNISMQKCVKSQHLDEQFGQHPIVLKAPRLPLNAVSW